MKKRVALVYGKDEVFDNPLGLEYLKAYCAKDAWISQSIEFETFTFESSEPPSQVARRILELAPSIVAASCYVWNTDRILEVCQMLKQGNPGILTVLGGPEVGHTPEKVCKDCPYVDVVVSGEGEEPFRQLLRAFLSDSLPCCLPGTTVRIGSSILSQAGGPPLDLAALPYLFHKGNKHYISSLSGKVHYETLRGCPHVCFFCDWGVMNRGQVRLFPIERVRQELDYILSKSSVRHLYLTDSEINVDDQHAKQVLQTIKALRRKHGWHGAVTFHLELSREIDSELFDLICDVTSGIGIGVQSLNPEALFLMGRRWFNRHRFEQNVARLEKRLRLVFQFIYGCPGDNYGSFRQSLQWAVDKGREVWFDRLRVLPGTIYRHKPERFGLCFDPRRPNFVQSANTFSAEDICRAESLKRGFLLYTYRDVIQLGLLRDFLGLDTMQLLESFGEWCTLNVPELSLAYARSDPPNLPIDFVGRMSSWIGRFILSARTVSWDEYGGLKARINGLMPFIPQSGALLHTLASPRGN